MQGRSGSDNTAWKWKALQALRPRNLAATFLIVTQPGCRQPLNSRGTVTALVRFRPSADFGALAHT